MIPIKFVSVHVINKANIADKVALF